MRTYLHIWMKNRYMPTIRRQPVCSMAVKSVSLDEDVGSVAVTVGIIDKARLSCPVCGKSGPVHDHRRRKWRHLDTCQFTTLVYGILNAMNTGSQTAMQGP